MPLGTFLNDDNPFRLRGLMFLSLSDLGQVLTRTPTSDSGGGVTETWGTATAIPCRVDPIGGAGMDEVAVANRLSDRSTHLITVTAGAAVTSNNRFLVAGRGTFEITAVRVRTGEWSRLLEAVQVS